MAPGDFLGKGLGSSLCRMSPCNMTVRLSYLFLSSVFLMKEGELLPLSMYGLAYHESLNAYLGKTHKGEVNFVDKDISMTGR